MPEVRGDALLPLLRAVGSDGASYESGAGADAASTVSQLLDRASGNMDKLDVLLVKGLQKQLVGAVGDLLSALGSGKGALEDDGAPLPQEEDESAGQSNGRDTGTPVERRRAGA